ncbi:putative proline--tRNA ligase, mitochondrial [Caenorhabditis elegans]|nr:proline--tRNA ligase [Caenorhabditis elegans]CAB04884.1 proline--tRNA ligase [Caenorhabditis elegans]|eukprot:NP_001040689.1 Prolyl Amino-acyl tRNA Synthetase [Caenorhabditis elegans]
MLFKARKWILSGASAQKSKSMAHTMLVENGFILPTAKGFYSLLPLGQRVIDKLCRILDVEFQNSGALKIAMPIVGTQQLWEKTGRWEAMGPEMIRFHDRQQNHMCLQPTAEEMCTELIATLSPLKKSQFPLIVYQIGEKFRDEMNPRFGLMRGRQFLMKDMYSFSTDAETSQQTYAQIRQIYDRIFGEILQLDEDVIKVEADSGVHGGHISHEYHLKSSLEEDFVNFCENCKNHNKFEGPGPAKCEKCAENSSKTVQKIPSVEIAHTFHLGTKYSEALGAKFQGKPLDMCCFGIGVTRLLPAAIDLLSVSDKALRLPRAIAPFDAVIIVKKSLMSNVIVEMASSSASRYLKGGILLDDRVEMSAGKRIHDANRLGIPFILVIANETERSLATQKPVIEVFTTHAKSAEPMSQGSMSLDRFVTFVQSTLYGGGGAHDSGHLAHNQVLDQLGSHQH